MARRSQEREVQPPQGWIGPLVASLLLLVCAWAVLASIPLTPLKMPLLTTRAETEGSRDALLREMLRTKGKAGPATRGEATRLLEVDPLNANALTFLGLAAEREGKAAQAQAFMQESLRRDPRGGAARAWFVFHAMQNDQVDEALKSTERLMALVPDAFPVALQIFVYFSERPEAQPRLMALLKRQSGWHDPFLAQLAAAKVSSETLARLGSAVATGGTDRGRAAVLDALIQRGNATQARKLWLDSLPANTALAKTLVYDPGFKKLAGLAPFNWSFKSGEDGSAEIDGDRGVAVDYFGRGNPTLAEQALLLKPGTYTLSVAVSAATANSESLSWGVYCNRTAKPLNKVALAAVQGAEPGVFRAQFIVPDWCSSQMLKLEGNPSEFSAVVNASIRSVEITPSKAGSSVPAKPAS